MFQTCNQSTIQSYKFTEKPCSSDNSDAKLDDQSSWRGTVSVVYIFDLVVIQMARALDVNPHRARYNTCRITVRQCGAPRPTGLALYAQK